MNLRKDFIRIAAVSPTVRPGDISFNFNSIKEELFKLKDQNVNVAVFPELCLTGYTCADLFNQSIIYDAVDEKTHKLAVLSEELNIAFAVGAPLKYKNSLYNCAVFLNNGVIAGVVPKSYIPNYNEFYEKRWFKSGIDITDSTISIGEKEIPFGTDLIFDLQGAKIGIEICEDLWVPEPPSGKLCIAGADIILNLSASDDNIGKRHYLTQLISGQSARCRCIYAYASAGKGESSTDLVFSGHCQISEDGTILASANRRNDSNFAIADADIEKIRYDRIRFNTYSDNHKLKDKDFRVIRTPLDFKVDDPLLREINPHPFIDPLRERHKENCEEILDIQSEGLAVRLNAIKCRKAVIGISGGLDSTLALIVTVEAFRKLNLDTKGIIAVTMPGFGTTGRTLTNALRLMSLLNVTSLEINIADAVNQHFKDIGHNPEVHDITYENSQARERTQILMDIANQENGLVIGTGDLSELALGWCTYNGDHISMYAVNTSIPKTLVKHIVATYAESAPKEIRETLHDIIDTPISPELLPASEDDTILQKTEDLVGPYELHDFFLYYVLRFGFVPSKIARLAFTAFEGKYERKTIIHWMNNFYRRFFNQQFKRSCMPDGPKVGSVCLSPRGDWRMPSDASSALWLKDLERLVN